MKLSQNPKAVSAAALSLFGGVLGDAGPEAAAMCHASALDALRAAEKAARPPAITQPLTLYVCTSCNAQGGYCERCKGVGWRPPTRFDIDVGLGPDLAAMVARDMRPVYDAIGAHAAQRKVEK